MLDPLIDIAVAAEEALSIEDRAADVIHIDFTNTPHPSEPASHTALLALVQRLSKLTTPTDGIDDAEKADDIIADLDDDTLCADAATLYSIIREARELLTAND